jgi:hypothetical protein
MAARDAQVLATGWAWARRYRDGSVASEDDSKGAAVMANPKQVCPWKQRGRGGLR